MEKCLRLFSIDQIRTTVLRIPGFRPVVLPAALTASDGLDGLVSVQQRLEGKATSVTAGFNGPATSRATC